MALFRISRDAIEAVRAKLDAARAAKLPTANPCLAAFTRGTKVSAKIES